MYTIKIYRLFILSSKIQSLLIWHIIWDDKNLIQASYEIGCTSKTTFSKNKYLATIDQHAHKMNAGNCLGHCHQNWRIKKVKTRPSEILIIIVHMGTWNDLTKWNEENTIMWGGSMEQGCHTRLSTTTLFFSGRKNVRPWGLYIWIHAETLTQSCTKLSAIFSVSRNLWAGHTKN